MQGIRIIARASVSALALAAVVPAFAQSTGTQEFDNSQIVVTAKNGDHSIAGTAISTTPKAKTSLTDEFISRQRAGQSIDDIINMLPGVSFQNNGPYGDAGGTLTIHGFDSSRISQTFDGIPLNDSGNYALYSQEQVDPELIKQVEVSTGSTDIDSPTASATGGTVNYTVRDPSEDFHVRLAGSMGEWQFMRVFGVVDTGKFTPFGTRAFVAASHQSDVNPYDSGSKLDRTQLNAKVYQPIGSNGDFVSVTGFYDRNRGNHFADFTLQESSFPGSASDISAKPPLCTTTPATPGAPDKANTCGTAVGGYYGYTQNPTNMWQIHMNSRFTLADGLVLTVEPNVGYTQANGGSIVTATEGNYNLKNGATTTPIIGFIGGKPYLGGVDLNGDGDTLDTVSVDAPSNTITRRYGVIANLIWHIAPTQTVRVNYTLDHARLRQTGELGYIGADGRPLVSFPKDNPILDATGNPIEKRDRLSYSILNQVSGEYRGEFFDNKLVVQAGVRAPFFKRDLTNNCVSESSGTGYVDCFNDPASQAAFLAANPSYQAPQSRHVNYNRVLPSAGLTFNVTPHASLFADYSQGLQVPSTDTLYDGFAFPVGDPASKPKLETTYNFEGGVRYKSHNIQAQLSGWYTTFHNRIEESSIEDPENPGTYHSVYTNLGTVHKYGFDGSITYAPDRHVTLYAFGSYLHSKILDNIQQGVCTANNAKFHDSAGIGVCETAGQPIIRATGGKQESGSPTYMFGGRVQGNAGPLEVGVQVKRTGPRYVNDQNTPIYDEDDLTSVVYPAKTPSYTLVDLDARLNLGFLGLNDKTYLQLNVTNLFDKFYVGGFDGQVGNLNYPSQYVYVGTPRTFSGTVNVAF